MNISTKLLILAIGVTTTVACAPITPLMTGGVNIPGPSGLPSGGLPGGTPMPSPGGQPGGSPGGQPGGQQGGQSGGQPGGQSGGQQGGSSGQGGGGGGQPSSYDIPSGGGGLPGSQSGGGGGVLVNQQGGGAGGSNSGEAGQDGSEQGPSGEGGQSGGGTGEPEPPNWDVIAGTGGSGDGEGSGDWATSNEVPEAEANAGSLESTGPGGSGGDGEEDDFAGALEEMDGEILAEREIVKSSPVGSSSIPAPSEEELPTEDGGGDQSTISPGPSLPSASTPIPPPPRRGAEGAPDDIPDAKDDDIIARQLREAAMQEEDPELKEKLWDEYRKYKKG